MNNIKLKDRIDSYKEATDFKLLNRVPLIICVNGRSFSKNTSLLEKPYCAKFSESMLSTTLRLCSEIDGTLFAYQFNDEIVLIVRNDQHYDTAAWYDNKLQKISSITASIATLHFNACAAKIDLNLTGDSLFTSQVFIVPNIVEAINTMIYKQQQNFQIAIQSACFYELLKKYDVNSIKEMLSGLSFDDKVDFLNQECNIDYNNYPMAFRRGAACYKIPKVFGGTMKSKWSVNLEIPIFTKAPDFLNNILKNGSDIFRNENF